VGGKYYIKLYIEILNDRKVAKLSLPLRWRMAECFLLAGQLDKKGLLPPVDEAAWLLRVGAEQLKQDWDALVDVEILDITGPDEYWVKNFAKRQAPISSAQRASEFRKRQRETLYYDDVTQALRDENENVTNRYTPEDMGDSAGASPTDGAPRARNENKTNRYREKRREEREKSTRHDSLQTRYENVTQDEEVVGRLFTIYEQNIGPLTPVINDEMGTWLENYSPEWIEDAIVQAARNNKRKCSYIGGILRNWYIEGRDNKGSHAPQSMDDELKRKGYASG
jgi:DnaD/phage-associated family protein